MLKKNCISNVVKGGKPREHAFESKKDGMEKEFAKTSVRMRERRRLIEVKKRPVKFWCENCNFLILFSISESCLNQCTGNEFYYIY